mmetsp:Transcript_22812/g.45569  ORF Transcript_22812/g.45569 Transcript_22812/m.45569 type:complete len:174 (-) Transcript_22812:71-592(-)
MIVNPALWRILSHFTLSDGNDLYSSESKKNNPRPYLSVLLYSLSNGKVGFVASIALKNIRNARSKLGELVNALLETMVSHAFCDILAIVAGLDISTRLGILKLIVGVVETFFTYGELGISWLRRIHAHLKSHSFGVARILIPESHEACRGFVAVRRGEDGLEVVYEAHKFHGL